MTGTATGASYFTPLTGDTCLPNLTVYYVPCFEKGGIGDDDSD